MRGDIVDNSRVVFNLLSTMCNDRKSEEWTLRRLKFLCRDLIEFARANDEVVREIAER